MPSDRDSLEFTTMTYRALEGGPDGYGAVSPDAYPQTYMMLDMLALQTMYGANYTTRSGDTFYRFDPTNAELLIDGIAQGVPQDASGNPSNILFRTLWDGGGIDTYDFSDYRADRELAIDLTPGGWIDVDRDSDFQAARLGFRAVTTPLGDRLVPAFARAQVYNAYLVNGDRRSLIENAIGGAGADSILGNDADNTLRGRDGDDTLEGFDGNDVLDQGAGGGLMRGGRGVDYAYAGPGADRIEGGDDFDYADYSRSPVGIGLGSSGDGLQGKATGGWADGDTLVGVEAVIGSEQGDTLFFTGATPWVFARGGHDTIQGGNSGDNLFGEAGNDLIVGGGGADRIEGGSGLDTAGFANAVVLDLDVGIQTGESAGDRYVDIEIFAGSDQADSIAAYRFAPNRLQGNGGADTLRGGEGNDTLQGGRGSDVLIGGGGRDMASYADAPSVVSVDLSIKDARSQGKVSSPEWGGDILTSIEDVEGSAFGDQLVGDDADNTLVGGGGADLLFGGLGADVLNGGIGDDSITAGGRDQVDGGEGFDTLDFGPGFVSVDLFRSEAYLNGAYLFVSGIEAVVGNDQVDSLVGSDRDERLTGRGGDDGVSGNGGNDTLDGGAGADFMAGGEGDDVLFIGPGNDFLDCGPGFDTVQFSRATVADWASGELDVDIAGDQWFDWDRIRGSDQADRIRIADWGVVALVDGGGGDDTLSGMAASDMFGGDDGQDLIDGGGGNDTMRGGTGLDTLLGGAGDDLMDGGADTDTVTYAGLAGGGLRVDLNLTTVQDTGLAGRDRLIDVENVIGAGGSDTLRGDARANLPNGNGGADTLQGGAGADVLIGAAGDDRLDGQQDADVLRPGFGNDTINGGGAPDTVDYTGESAVTVDLALTGAQDTRGAGLDTLISIENAAGTTGADVLLGNAGANVLLGRDGADVLQGRGGADRLTGGAGPDVFVYRLASDAPVGGTPERITDFEVGLDRLDFSGFDSVVATPGLEALSFVDGAFTGFGQVRYAGGRLQLNLDGDLTDAEFGIAMPGAAGLSAADLSLPGSAGAAGRELPQPVTGVWWA